MAVKQGLQKRSSDAVIISDYGLVPPQDLRVESVVLGSILIDAEAFDRVSDILTPECFYDKQNQNIFAAIEEMAVNGMQIDMVTVTNYLQTKGIIEECGGLKHLMDLNSSVNSSAHVKSHANILHEMFMSRQIIRFCAETERAAYERTVPVKEMLQSIEDKLYSLGISGTKHDFYSMGEMLYGVVKEIEESQTKAGMSGLATGFRQLDKATGGWQKSDLIIIAARTAMGKTALVLSIARNMMENNVPVGIFSLEMSRQQLLKRLITNVTEISANKIRNGQMSNLDWTVLKHQTTLINNMPLYIDDSANITIFELATKARRLVREHKVEIIFVDYLQLIHAESKTINNREQEVSTISRSLKQLAKELNIPIVALSQLNRAVETRVGDNKRPMLSDLRESGAIEQDSDMVLLLHRPEYYEIMEDDQGNSLKGVAELIVAKNRSGSTGTFRIEFKSDIIKFCDFEDESRFLSYTPVQPVSESSKNSSDVRSSSIIADKKKPVKKESTIKPSVVADIPTEDVDDKDSDDDDFEIFEGNSND